MTSTSGRESSSPETQHDGHRLIWPIFLTDPAVGWRTSKRAESLDRYSVITDIADRCDVDMVWPPGQPYRLQRSGGDLAHAHIPALRVGLRRSGLILSGHPGLSTLAPGPTGWTNASIRSHSSAHQRGPPPAGLTDMDPKQDRPHPVRDEPAAIPPLQPGFSRRRSVSFLSAAAPG